MSMLPKPTRAKSLFDSLANGLGAVKLSPSVSALRLKCHKRPGMKGERQFINDVLPRLAFSNPSTPIHVSHFPQYIPKAEREAAGSTTAASSAASTSTATADKSSKSKVKPKLSTITVEFKNLPPRQISIGQKSASEIAKELLDLARFTEQALAGDRRSTASSTATPAATATTIESAEQTEAETIEVAPEPTSTNLAGSAEGLSDVDGQKATP